MHQGAPTCTFAAPTAAGLQVPEKHWTPGHLALPAEPRLVLLMPCALQTARHMRLWGLAYILAVILSLLLEDLELLQLRHQGLMLPLHLAVRRLVLQWQAQQRSHSGSLWECRPTTIMVQLSMAACVLGLTHIKAALSQSTAPGKDCIRTLQLDRQS